MLKRQCNIILFCLTLTACGLTQATYSQTATETLKLTTDSTYPCQLANPDTSLFDIILLDPKSSIKQVGEKYVLIDDHKDMMRKHFCSQDQQQTLTLFFHYGGSPNEVTEFQVKQYSPSDSATTLKTNNFVTNSGIKLGLSRQQIISILGNCFKTIRKDKHFEIIKYRIDNFDNSDFLTRFNYPVYYADYEFQDNKLVRFRFGFEYP